MNDMKRIYSGKGDKGETDLIGGKRVLKDNLRIASLGDVDELNAAIGVAMTAIEDREIVGILHRIQNDLFTMGADLSVVPGKKPRLPNVEADHVKALEADIEKMSPRSARKFVLPGGSTDVAHLQFVRTVARRAERTVVSLSKKEKVNPLILTYLNRLSTLLYVLALSLKRSAGVEEEHPTYLE